MKKYLMAYLSYVILVLSLILLAWYAVSQVSKAEYALLIVSTMFVLHFKVNIRVCDYFGNKFQDN